MGHKKKDGRNSRTLHQQAYDKLQKMQAFGDSKRLDKMEHPEEFARKLYSFSTYQTYFKHIKYFFKWIQKEHPEIKTLKKAEKSVPEWLQTRVDKGLSAWTIQTEAAALNKLYQIKPADKNRFQPPERLKENIVRSRVVSGFENLHRTGLFHSASPRQRQNALISYRRTAQRCGRAAHESHAAERKSVAVCQLKLRCT